MRFELPLLILTFFSQDRPSRLPTQDAASTKPSPFELELTFLANEGFLIEAGGDKVLIDAFVETPVSIYAALPKNVRDKLVACEPPFDGIDLALATHAHPDHFQASLACAFLSAATDCLFVSSEEVFAKLEASCGTDGERFESLLPAPSQSSFFKARGIELELLRLSHGSRYPDAQNLGHILRIAGRTVLSLGDADMAPSNFEPYGFGDRKIDVALVPYWYFTHPNGKRFVRETLQARHVVAVHVPPEELPQVARLLENRFPEVVLFRESMESLVFLPEDASAPAGEATNR